MTERAMPRQPYRYVIGTVGVSRGRGAPMTVETLRAVAEALGPVRSLDINMPDLIGTFRVVRHEFDGTQLVVWVHREDEWRRLQCANCHKTELEIVRCLSCGCRVCSGCIVQHNGEKHG